MEAVEVCMSSVDIVFLHGRRTQTDRLMVTFFPPLQYKECAQEFVNQKGLRRHILCSHKCVRERERASTAAASEEINNCHFCHRESRVQNGAGGSRCTLIKEPTR